MNGKYDSRDSQTKWFRPITITRRNCRFDRHNSLPKQPLTMTPESPSQETEPLLRTRRSGIRPRNSPGTIKRLTSAIDPPKRRPGPLTVLCCHRSTRQLSDLHLGLIHQYANRQHCISGARTGPSRRREPLDQIRHIDHELLPWLCRVRFVPSGFPTAATMGAVLILLTPGSLYCDSQPRSVQN